MGSQVCCANPQGGDQNAVVVSDIASDKVFMDDSEPPASLKSLPPAVEGDGLTIVLLDTFDKEQTVTAKYKPLGLVFEKTFPIRVSDFKVESTAKALGIEIGWTFKSVGGVDLIEKGYNFEDALDVLSTKVAELPVDQKKTGCLICFDVDPSGTGCGREEILQVQYRPLGLNFDDSMPLKVTKANPSSYGGLLGAKVGWVFKSINGESLQDVPFETAKKTLERHMGTLPEYKGS
jgi:hypothetical protein